MIVVRIILFAVWAAVFILFAAIESIMKFVAKVRGK